MRKSFIVLAFAFAAAVTSFSSCSILLKTNPAYLAQAAGKAMTAASITDEDIVQLCRQSISEMDKKSKIDHGSYQQRLERLMSGVDSLDGMPINLKVYNTAEINAFASGDGSIRVYSGLMDVMDDSELLAIIGHEMGHVAHKDTKSMMKKAYMASAARDIVSSSGTAIGDLSKGVLGDITESFVSAQFSQKQEYAADQYGFNFAISRGQSPYSMCNALEKLVSLSKGSKASMVVQMFSSHPDSEERAKKMRNMAKSYERANRK